MTKKPNRSWSMVVSLGIPLAVVGVSAMAISYATLIDVARVNGMPLPELFPVLVDVGTVATMIAAAQFRLRGVPGRWLAYTTFILLSGVSIVANATHAWRAADLTLTSPWAAAVLASTPPAALLAITHLVMMLIPDEKERSKLQAKRERAELLASKQTTFQRPPAASSPTSNPSVAAHPPEQPARAVAHVSATTVPEPRPELPSDVVTSPLRLVQGEQPEVSEGEVRAWVLDYVRDESKRPTGKLVGEWLGDKTPKTGQRFLKKMEEEGGFEQPSELLASAL